MIFRVTAWAMISSSDGAGEGDGGDGNGAGEEGGDGDVRGGGGGRYGKYLFLPPLPSPSNPPPLFPLP